MCCASCPVAMRRRGTSWMSPMAGAASRLPPREGRRPRGRGGRGGTSPAPQATRKRRRRPVRAAAAAAGGWVPEGRLSVLPRRGGRRARAPGGRGSRPSASSPVLSFSPFKSPRVSPPRRFPSPFRYWCNLAVCRAARRAEGVRAPSTVRTEGMIPL